jgi:hypothetical protein
VTADLSGLGEPVVLEQVTDEQRRRPHEADLARPGKVSGLLIKTLLPDMATHDDDVTLLLIGLPMPKGECFRT